MSFFSLGGFNYSGTTFSIGTDFSYTITDSGGSPVDLGGRIIEFDASPKGRTQESAAIDNGGLVKHRYIPGGWSGTFIVERASAAGDTFQANQDSDFYNLGLPDFYTIQETCQDKVGATSSSVSIYQFTNCVVALSHTGKKTRDNRVELTYEFAAEERIRIQ